MARGRIKYIIWHVEEGWERRPSYWSWFTKVVYSGIFTLVLGIRVHLTVFWENSLILVAGQRYLVSDFRLQTVGKPIWVPQRQHNVTCATHSEHEAILSMEIAPKSSFLSKSHCCFLGWCSYVTVTGDDMFIKCLELRLSIRCQIWLNVLRGERN